MEPLNVPMAHLLAGSNPFRQSLIPTDLVGQIMQLQCIILHNNII